MVETIVLLQTRDRKTAVKPEVDMMEAFQAYKHTALKGVKRKKKTVFMNVYLTGSTGFLGSRILRQLCRDPRVHRILVHVRSSDTQIGLQRIVGVYEADQAASESKSLTQFVFVSGSQLPRVEDKEEDASIAKEVGLSSGYAQFKFLSELMIKEYARVLASGRQRILIVKPGYIIGSKQDGRAAVDDFTWRLTASCAGLQTYSAAEDTGSWLFISDVDRIAGTVSGCCCPYETVQGQSSQAFEIVQIFDGLPRVRL
ncbi:MAG: hypothetical protein Q9186_001461 [Xanthomendoza sp. 1 TL-2023]